MSSYQDASIRFGEFSKMLPVLMVIGGITMLYVQYVFLHCGRLLQLDLPWHARDVDEFSRAHTDLIVFHVITSAMLYCFGRCILTHPGTIPVGSWWEIDDDNDNVVEVLEKKNSGARRHCKWCQTYKPDRCHHCRMCNQCILKMDHHCPWVYNCIGHRNHKYFFLLLLYAMIDLLWISVSMFDSLWAATRTDVDFCVMLTLFFGEACSIFMLVIVTFFFSFHVWLMLQAMTTVEFCEKSLKNVSYDNSVYSLGCYGNICVVLGPRPLLWLLPFSLPEGDGTMWSVNGTSAARLSAVVLPSTVNERQTSPVVSQDGSDSGGTNSQESKTKDASAAPSDVGGAHDRETSSSGAGAAPAAPEGSSAVEQAPVVLAQAPDAAAGPPSPAAVQWAAPSAAKAPEKRSSAAAAVVPAAAAAAASPPATVEPAAPGPAVAEAADVSTAALSAERGEGGG